MRLYQDLGLQASTNAFDSKAKAKTFALYKTKVKARGQVMI